MIVYLLFILIGGLLLAGAIWDLRGRIAFLKEGERSLGTVVRVEERQEDEGIYYYPVFRIVSGNGEAFTYRHGTASSSPAWQVGEQAMFIFVPGRPETARFLRYWPICWWPLSLMAAAAILLLTGGGYFLLRGYVAYWMGFHF